MNRTTSQTRPFALLAIAATAVGAGGFIGGTVNAINGAVSPASFRVVMRWGDVEPIWRASLALGTFTGLIHGLVFSGALALVIGVVSRARCTFTFALRQPVAIIARVYGCWFLGGVIGMGLAALSPEFFQRASSGVPDQHGDMIRHAWVGGSIPGATAGGALALVIGPILSAARWRRAQHTHVKRESDDDSCNRT